MVQSRALFAHPAGSKDSGQRPGSENNQVEKQGCRAKALDGVGGPPARTALLHPLCPVQLFLSTWQELQRLQDATLLCKVHHQMAHVVADLGLERQPEGGGHCDAVGGPARGRRRGMKEKLLDPSLALEPQEGYGRLGLLRKGHATFEVSKRLVLKRMWSWNVSLGRVPFHPILHQFPPPQILFLSLVQFYSTHPLGATAAGMSLPPLPCFFLITVLRDKLGGLRSPQ